MKPAANTSANPTQKIIQPSKTGVFAGKLGHLKSTARAAIAALGLFSVEKLQAGPIILNGLQGATVVGPVLEFGSGANHTAPGSLSGTIYNSRIFDTNAKTSDISIDRFTIDLSSAPVGAGGTLTITGKLTAGTDNLVGHNGLSVTAGTAGSIFRLIQEAQFGIAGGPMTTIKSLDSGIKYNYGSTSYTDAESWSGDSGTFSYNIPLTQRGIYHLDNKFTRTNTSGHAQFESFSIKYTPFLDINSNSILDTWETKNFGELMPGNDDADKDGLTNLMEFGFNTDPTVANHTPLTYSFEVMEGKQYLAITFPKNPDATNLTYSVESSEDLKSWMTDTIKLSVSATQEKVRSVLSIENAPRLFLRVKVDKK